MASEAEHKLVTRMLHASGDAEIRRLWHAMSQEQQAQVTRIVIALGDLVEFPEEDA